VEDFISLQGIFEQGYGFIGKKPMRDKELHYISKAIYSYICSFSGKGKDSFPSQKLMCSDLGMSKDTLTKYLEPLKTKGYITVKQNKKEGKFSNNVYSINLLPLPISSDTVKTVTDIIGYGETDTINNKVLNNNNILNNNKKTSSYKQIKSNNIISLDIYNHYCKKIKDDGKKQLGLNNINTYIAEFGVPKLIYAIDRYSEEVEEREDKYKKSCYSFFAVKGEEIGFFKDYINKKPKEKKEVKIYNPLQQEEEIKF